MQGPLRQRANAFCKRLRRWCGIDDRAAGEQHGFFRSLPDLLISALFVASAVHLLPGLTLPLEIPARLVVSNVAAHWLADDSNRKYPEDDDFALLKIDSKTFRDKDRYGGRSPLDRCQFRKDLGLLLEKLPALQALGIDFDLSPTGDEQQDRCAAGILSLLREHSRIKAGFVSTVIQPVNPDERKEFEPWRAQVRAHGVQLAEPDLDVQLGMVREHIDDEHGCPGLGVAVGHRAPDAKRQERCAKDDQAGAGGGKPFTIAFHRLALLKHAPRSDAGDSKQIQTLDQQLDALDGSAVTRLIIGPGYDHSDEFVSPLGLLNGVDVHAAIALMPHEERKAWLDFLIDIALGVLFGWAVHRIWHSYFNQRLDRFRHFGQPRLAYKWLVLLVALLLVGCFFVLPVASTVVTVVWGLWISPVPMLVGMTVDALVTGSVSAAIGRHEHLVAASAVHHAPQASATHAAFHPGIVQVIGLHLPALLWLFVVGKALFGLVSGDAH